MGHTTWDDYSKMTRVFKYYKFHIEDAETVGTHIAFSGYPGVISSTDDFYMTDSGLAVMETSLELLDRSAWDGVLDFPTNPHLPNFVHVMVATRLAKSAAHWARTFSSVNTGTYTSQWMAVDYNKFKPGAPVQDNTLWVVEAIPGLVQLADMSGFLREHGFWPSFNRPFFKRVREASGHASAERSHGTLYSWDANPRAAIFAAAAVNANGLFDMRRLMSGNSYDRTGAAQSQGSPGHQISARMDLLAGLSVPNGGIDTKITSSCFIAKMEVQAISGPSHQGLPPFRWTTADGSELWPGWPHTGLPDVWDFDFVQMSPQGFGELDDTAGC